DVAAALHAPAIADGPQAAPRRLGEAEDAQPVAAAPAGARIVDTTVVAVDATARQVACGVRRTSFLGLRPLARPLPEREPDVGAELAAAVAGIGHAGLRHAAIFSVGADRIHSEVGLVPRDRDELEGIDTGSLAVKRRGHRPPDSVVGG